MIIHIKNVLTKKFFDFRGRSTRAEFWYFHLFLLMCLFLFVALVQVVEATGPDETIKKIFSFSSLILYIVILIPQTALWFRRLHDSGESGFWLLVSIVPLIGPLLLLVSALKDSELGDNKYGPNPKI